MSEGDKAMAANLRYWQALETTNPEMTKKVTQGKRTFHSIDATWQFERMTELFGPAGDGWGYEIVRSEIIDLGPAMGSEVTVHEDGSKTTSQVEIGRVRIHTCEVKLWYVRQDGKVCSIPGVGHTKMTYVAKQNGVPYLFVDEDYEKKSITDAVTKAMSFLGMGADVRKGFFDQKDYEQTLRDETGLTAAEQREAEAVKSRHEFEDWAQRTMDLMATAGSLRELELIYRPAKIKVVNRGTEELQKDFEHVKTVRARELIEAKKKAEAEAKEAEAEGGES